MTLSHANLAAALLDATRRLRLAEEQLQERDELIIALEHALARATSEALTRRETRDREGRPERPDTYSSPLHQAKTVVGPRR
jgi:hypothetical protein